MLAMMASRRGTQVIATRVHVLRSTSPTQVAIITRPFHHGNTMKSLLRVSSLGYHDITTTMTTRLFASSSSSSSLNFVMEGHDETISSQSQPFATTLQQSNQQYRTFSSRRKRPNKRSSSSSNNNTPLANENLIKVLMKGSRNPNDVTVRVVIDHQDTKKTNTNTNSKDTPNQVQIVSLPEAIEISVERNLDLIAATLDSDPPTIRCTQLSKLLYKKEQAQRQNANQQAKKQQQKTFRFKAGIDNHDLERKINDMTKFLQQGLECEYSIFTKAFTLRSNANAGNELSERIQELVAEYGQLKRKPQINEAGNYIRCTLEPKKK